MPAPTVRITTEIDEFATSLQRGDVLLFDSIHALSHLIKFAENRPVSHCALYLGDGTFAHVGRHKPGKTRKDPPSVPAARTDSLTEWLKSPPGPYDRTVTALRHIDVSRASDTDGVAGRALEYVDPRNSTYNYLSLIALMVPSLLRTYKHFLKDKAALALVEGAMQAVSEFTGQRVRERRTPGFHERTVAHLFGIRLSLLPRGRSIVPPRGSRPPRQVAPPRQPQNSHRWTSVDRQQRVPPDELGAQWQPGRGNPNHRQRRPGDSRRRR